VGIAQLVEHQLTNPPAEKKFFLRRAGLRETLRYIVDVIDLIIKSGNSSVGRASASQPACSKKLFLRRAGLRETLRCIVDMIDLIIKSGNSSVGRASASQPACRKKTFLTAGRAEGNPQVYC